MQYNKNWYTKNKHIYIQIFHLQYQFLIVILTCKLYNLFPNHSTFEI